MTAKCGADCSACGFGMSRGCKGCEASRGCPFGKQCFIEKIISLGGKEAYSQLVSDLTEQINAIGFPGMIPVQGLVPLVGGFVNLPYRLPGGETVKFLEDDRIYLGAQTGCEFDDGLHRCFGVVTDTAFVLISSYGENGADPELVLYRKW